MNWIGIAAVLPIDNPFRGMNPFIQQMKFDPDFKYIKKWVPEIRSILGSVSGTERSDAIKKLEDEEREEPVNVGEHSYNAPVVDYTKSRAKYMKWAKK